MQETKNMLHGIMGASLLLNVGGQLDVKPA